MNNLTSNGDFFGKPSTAPIRPNEIENSEGYSYSNFVNDLLFNVLLNNMEYTNKYALVRSEEIFAPELNNMLTFGFSNGFLWLVQVADNIGYLEVVENRVQKDITKLYAKTYLESQSIEADDDNIDEIVKELEETYMFNIMSFVKDMNNFVVKGEGDASTEAIFGVASSSENNFTSLDGFEYRSFKTPLTFVIKISQSLGYRTRGLWGASSYHKFENPSGLWTESLQGIVVSPALEAIYIQALDQINNNKVAKK